MSATQLPATMGKTKEYSPSILLGKTYQTGPWATQRQMLLSVTGGVQHGSFKLGELGQ